MQRLEQYQNDLDVLEREVACIKQSIKNISALGVTGLEDINHPMNMIVNQLTKTLVKIGKKNHALEVLVDEVLPPVMEQCKSGSWDCMNLEQRREWFMNRTENYLNRVERSKDI